jgi:hypothetical protein
MGDSVKVRVDIKILHVTENWTYEGAHQRAFV